MKTRLAALVLPLLLLAPVGASAQSAAPVDDSECVIPGAFLLDASCNSLTDAQKLANAQAAWDALADKLGSKATTAWLGPRPVVFKDVWWMDPTNPVAILLAAQTR